MKTPEKTNWTGYMQTSMVGLCYKKKTLTLICHLYFEELISCRQLQSKNARASTSSEEIPFKTLLELQYIDTMP